MHIALAIARVCHEANRAYCVTIGDTSHLPWDEAPTWQRTSAVEGVEAMLRGEAPTPEASHEGWSAFKRETGWTYGPVKDEVAKTHPCLVPYAELPPEQQRKDALFGAIVAALK